MLQVMAETSVKVYYGNTIMLPDVARVLACLHEKDVRFEIVNMNKGAKQLLPMDFFKLQEKALKRVPGPAFEDGSKVLFESRAICRHLSEKYSQQGNSALLGRDPLERASIEQWLRSEEHSFDPPSWALFFHLAVAPYVDPVEREDRSDLIQECERKLSEVLDVYNQRLGDSKYLAGNDFSMADLSHLPNSHYLANSKEWSYLFSSRKHVRKWWKKISERSSWVKTVKIIDQLPVLAGKSSLSSTKTLIPPPPRPSQTAATQSMPPTLKKEAGGDSEKKDQKTVQPAATANEGTAKLPSGEENPVVKGTSTPVPSQRSAKLAHPTPKQEAGGESEKKNQKTVQPTVTADAAKVPTGSSGKPVIKETTKSVPPTQKQEVGGDSEKNAQTLKPANTADAAGTAEVPTDVEKSVQKAREIDTSPPSPDRSSPSNGGKPPEPPTSVSS